jgi:hypothetical protein
MVAGSTWNLNEPSIWRKVLGIRAGVVPAVGTPVTTAVKGPGVVHKPEYATESNRLTVPAVLTP